MQRCIGLPTEIEPAAVQFRSIQLSYKDYGVLLRTWIIIKPQYSLVYFIQKQRRFLS
jgi:hypothetical protein